MQVLYLLDYLTLFFQSLKLELLWFFFLLQVTKKNAKSKQLKKQGIYLFTRCKSPKRSLGLQVQFDLSSNDWDGTVLTRYCPHSNLIFFHTCDNWKKKHISLTTGKKPGNRISLDSVYNMCHVTRRNPNHGLVVWNMRIGLWFENTGTVPERGQDKMQK